VCMAYWSLLWLELSVNLKNNYLALHIVIVCKKTNKLLH